ncbi:MAG: hypothetical protein HYV33_01310 [Candidatus Kerfeldbacteria bacterium]|nr:hypothetical protein [Candidatus Kerfeldbacteria bacterium]
MPDIYSILQQLKLAYIQHNHPALFTCEQAEPYYRLIPGAKSKNLFLRNRKGDTHYLVILPSHKRADLKQLARIVHEKDISFASSERLQQYLGVIPGSVC